MSRASEIDFFSSKRLWSFAHAHGKDEAACPWCGFDEWNVYENLEPDDWTPFWEYEEGFRGEMGCPRCDREFYIISVIRTEPGENEVHDLFLVFPSEQRAEEALS